MPSLPWWAAGLLDRGLGAEEIRQLFRPVDWLLDLPEELGQQFLQEIHDYEREKKMPCITSVERMGIDKGRREELLETITFGVQKKFGAEAAPLLAVIGRIAALDRRRAICQSLVAGASLEQVRRLVPGESAAEG